MKTEVEYCLMVIENAKARGNKSCQVPIFAKEETIKKMNELGYDVRQLGEPSTDTYTHLYINFK